MLLSDNIIFLIESDPDDASTCSDLKNTSVTNVDVVFSIDWIVLRKKSQKQFY